MRIIIKAPQPHVPPSVEKRMLGPQCLNSALVPLSTWKYGVVRSNCGWKRMAGQNGSFAAGLVHGGQCGRLGSVIPVIPMHIQPQFWCQWEFCPWPNQNLAPSGICVTLIFVFDLLVYRIPARTTHFVC